MMPHLPYMQVIQAHIQGSSAAMQMMMPQPLPSRPLPAAPQPLLASAGRAPRSGIAGAPGAAALPPSSHAGPVAAAAPLQLARQPSAHFAVLLEQVEQNIPSLAHSLMTAASGSSGRSRSSSSASSAASSAPAPTTQLVGGGALGCTSGTNSVQQRLIGAAGCAPPPAAAPLPHHSSRYAGGLQVPQQGTTEAAAPLGAPTGGLPGGGPSGGWSSAVGVGYVAKAQQPQHQHSNPPEQPSSSRARVHAAVAPSPEGKKQPATPQHGRQQQPWHFSSLLLATNADREADSAEGRPDDQQPRDAGSAASPARQRLGAALPGGGEGDEFEAQLSELDALRVRMGLALQGPRPAAVAQAAAAAVAEAARATMPWESPGGPAMGSTVPSPDDLTAGTRTPDGSSRSSPQERARSDGSGAGSSSGRGQLLERLHAVGMPPSTMQQPQAEDDSGSPPSAAGPSRGSNAGAGHQQQPHHHHHHQVPELQLGQCMRLARVGGHGTDYDDDDDPDQLCNMASTRTMMTDAGGQLTARGHARAPSWGHARGAAAVAALAAAPAPSGASAARPDLEPWAPARPAIRRYGDGVAGAALPGPSHPLTTHGAAATAAAAATPRSCSSGSASPSERCADGGLDVDSGCGGESPASEDEGCGASSSMHYCDAQVPASPQGPMLLSSLEALRQRASRRALRAVEEGPEPENGAGPGDTGERTA